MDGLNKATTDQASDGLMRLERQLERGSKYTHSVIGESMLRTGEMQMLLHGLLDTLLAKGIINERELLDAMHKVRAELAGRDELNWVRAMIRNDATDRDEVGGAEDCKARLHICKSVCCKLDFALNVAELAEAEVKWDLGRPYFIRHERNGYCSHLDCGSGACGIYAKRPGVCRTYSCAGDRRIWLDFDRMELNHEWIEANLSGVTEPVVTDVFMHDPTQLHVVSEKEQSTDKATP